MTSLHIAGFPVEELLIVALVSAAPMLALVALELRSRVRRIVQAVRRIAAGAPDESTPSRRSRRRQPLARHQD